MAPFVGEQSPELMAYANEAMIRVLICRAQAARSQRRFGKQAVRQSGLTENSCKALPSIRQPGRTDAGHSIQNSSFFAVPKAAKRSPQDNHVLLIAWPSSKFGAGTGIRR
ncbi:MAG: hypothetical protein EXS02_12155 [Planctomycetes bacterium]|nr:hypothetical protein [Planctomycetota bacterium]